MSLKVSVVGAGGLGTAIAQLISINVDSVYLYARREEVVAEMSETGYNNEYYPNLKLASNIIPTGDFNHICECSIIFLCVPSSGIRSTLLEMSEFDCGHCIFVSAAKGIEYPSLKTMSGIVKEYFHTSPVVLSGPNFAYEIALSLFTATNLASDNPNYLRQVKKVLTTDEFKVKINNDVVGTEYCGIIKNVNAIAYGICEGMNLKDNARFAVLNKSFIETKNIINAVGGNVDTVDDYCGFGDLVLTATSRESRNHTMGMLYGQKIVVDEKASGILFEGKNSIMAIKEICDRNKVNCSIVDFVYDVIVKFKPINPSFRKLWGEMEH